MGTVRLSFIIIVALSALGASSALLVPSAMAQDAVPRAEPQPRPEPPARPERPAKTEPQSKAAPKAQPNRGAATPPPAAAAAEREEPAPGCGWIGKRVIQSLLRDDAVTAQDFDRLYRTFNCPGEYLRLAFDCTVVNGAPQTAQDTLIRVDGCWNDPKFDMKSPKIQLQSTPNSSTNAPGTSAPLPKGAATGKAPPPASATPNYPKGK
jgi:hypothetical protein